MKKVLLASTVLAMTATVAAAEVAVTGSARMGLVYDSISSDTVFSSRVRIVFSASGETDGGLSFGASMRADQIGGNAAPSTGTSNGDSTVFISGAFGKLTMGDVGGAADALVGQVSGVGYGPNDALQEIGFVGTSKTAAYYEYSTGGLTFGVGFGQTNSVGKEKSIAVKYAVDAYAVAIGYESSDNPAIDDLLSLSGSATFGAATVKARISDSNAGTPFALSVDYKAGATTVTAFYTDFDLANDQKHIGLGAAYDLGGGATLAGGIVRQDTNVGGETFADVGVKFAF